MISFDLDEVLNDIEHQKKNPKPKPEPVIRILTDTEAAAITPTPAPLPAPPPLTEQEEQAADEIITTLENEMASIFRQRGKLSSSIYQAVYGKSTNFPIDARAMLQRLDVTTDVATNEVRTFGIRFIAAGGETKELLDCRKAISEPHRQTNNKPQERGKFKYNLKKKGTILLGNAAKPYRSVIVSTIYEFKDFKTNKWLRVKH